MSESPDSHERSTGPGWLAWAVVGLALYVLSTGPISGMVARGTISQPIADLLVTTVYAPLDLLAQNVDVVRDFFQWYMSFFGS